MSSLRSPQPEDGNPLNPLSPNSSPGSSPENPIDRFPVVGIGASAGGLEAFTRLLHHLPIDTGMAFVLVQHLDPNQPSLLSEILARATQMSVQEAQEGIAIAPNQVYVIPPNRVMTIELAQNIVNTQSR